MDGEDEEGLRKKGVSRSTGQAIVQMGLLLDGGVPWTTKLFPGNVNDMSTMLPMMRRPGLRDAGSPDGRRVVVVADKGLNTSNNIAACAGRQRFVFSQSVRRATKGLKEWVLDRSGTKVRLGRFKVKSRTRQDRLRHQARTAEEAGHGAREGGRVLVARLLRNGPA